MAQIMGSVNNVQLLPDKEGPAGKNGYKPVDVDGLPRSGQMVVADFRASMKKGKRPVRWMAGWRPIGFDMLEAA